MPERPTPPPESYQNDDQKEDKKKKKPLFRGLRIKILKRKKPLGRQTETPEQQKSREIPEQSDIDNKISYKIRRIYTKEPFPESRRPRDPRFRRREKPIKPTSKSHEQKEKEKQAEAQYKKMRTGFMAGLLLGLTIGYGPFRPKQNKPKAHLKITEELADLVHNPDNQRFTHFDEITDIFRKVPHGEFSRQEKKRRTDKESVPGLTIFHDIGRDFVFVPKGESIAQIKKRLSQNPRYSYLKEQKSALKSFNIQLQEGDEPLQEKFVPIPLSEKERKISDLDFAFYCLEAIEQMRHEPRYAREMENLLEVASKKELIATMFAVAKQEGGGKPLGQFVWQRYEPGSKAFSYSVFHVLMRGPGRKAREHLNITEGQLASHPVQAGKVFLGFLIEKQVFERHRSLDAILPLRSKTIAFTNFYNGTNWRNKNPQYPEHIITYLEDAIKFLQPDHLQEIQERGRLAYRSIDPLNPPADS